MTWFDILSIKNIALVLIGWVIGRYWNFGKKVIKMFKEDNTKKI